MGAVVLTSVVIAPMGSGFAASKPVALSFPSQLPQAIAGKSYSYTFATRVTGGTGKPYTFTLTGALPLGLVFNSSKGVINGAIPKTAKNGKYTFKICATGAKKAGSNADWNTACKVSTLVLTGGAAGSSVSTDTSGSSANSSGTYAGNVTIPVMTPCTSSTFERTVTLIETAGGVITGKTNHGYPTTLTGIRVGNSITVTLQMQFGPRGPFVWQWDGNTLIGSMPATCVDTSTQALLAESSYQFNLSKKSAATTYSLTVSKAGDGFGDVIANSGALSCGSTCQASYNAGQTISLSATPRAGAIFNGWSGACSGNGSCTLTLNSNLDVTANFSANSSGTYAGNVTIPVMAPCTSSTFERTITLTETAGGVITGKTNHGFPTTLTGTRVGNSITVTLQMQVGTRGPLIWQWRENTLTGSLPAYCWDEATMKILNESSYQFNLTKK